MQAAIDLIDGGQAVTQRWDDCLEGADQILDSGHVDLHAAIGMYYQGIGAYSHKRPREGGKDGGGELLECAQ